MAKGLNSRPSELLAIKDPLSAFYFDRAVSNFGRTVEADMDEAAEGAKNSKETKRRRQMAFAKYMKDEHGNVAPGTFRDPAALARRKSE